MCWKSQSSAGKNLISWYTFSRRLGSSSIWAHHYCNCAVGLENMAGNTTYKAQLTFIKTMQVILVYYWHIVHCELSTMMSYKSGDDVLKLLPKSGMTYPVHFIAAFAHHFDLHSDQMIILLPPLESKPAKASGRSKSMRLQNIAISTQLLYISANTPHASSTRLCLCDHLDRIHLLQNSLPSYILLATLQVAPPKFDTNIWQDLVSVARLELELLLRCRLQNTI